MITVSCRCGISLKFRTDRRVRHYCPVAGGDVVHYPANWKGPRPTADFCPHLGEATGESTTVVYVCRPGQRTEVALPIYSCGAFVECLPTYSCSETSKNALAEWAERNGREIEMQTCRGCPLAPTGRK